MTGIIKFIFLEFDSIDMWSGNPNWKEKELSMLWLITSALHLKLKIIHDLILGTKNINLKVKVMVLEEGLTKEHGIYVELKEEIFKEDIDSLQ